MADVKPFKALMFNQSLVDLREVVMPPYDIIKDNDVEKFYKKSDYNIIRIDRGLDMEGDGPDNNKYTRAKACMDEWIIDGVLKQDDREALYIYTQEYKMPGGKKGEMLSFFAAVKIEEFDKKIVLPHERTHPGPKQDRLELMRATRSNTSPILSLYFDREKRVHALLKTAMKKSNPFINIRDEKKLAFRMWRVDDAATIKKAVKLLGKKQLFIADGHHRYETALNFRNEMREKTGAKETPYDRILMCLISMENSGVTILPTHRMFRAFKPFDPECDMLKRFFKMKEMKNPAGIKKAMTAKGKRKSIGMLYKGKAWLLILKEDEYRKIIPKGQHVMDYYFLSVTILHYLIFEKILGITDRDIISGISYTQDINEAVNSVIKGGYEAAFLTRPATMDEIKVISLKNEVMPQKSTYFLPKLVTGFLINKMG
ncbi:MAG: DUF1015 domain-containing protein [Spirochaetia bacterium]|nr:DUF1015 domain-containing protein [Spirochaetia bacterium]